MKEIIEIVLEIVQLVILLPLFVLSWIIGILLNGMIFLRKQIKGSET